MMNSISFTGSPSLTMYASLVLRDETRRSQMASRSCSSIWEKKGTRRTRARHRWRWISRRRSRGRDWRMDSSSTPRVASHLYWKEAAHAFLELRGKLTVTHPLLDVATLHAPLLQPHRHRLQVRLI
ncbi:hypothetical protein PR202_ga25107 [Eleusine coracana subsp. coracana]|uniref:Uncharacterized protein n=1 Tax=Eleusine coracana subsp. coracana TaxID=191504 RepID=A0AAV5DB18_ELECO|nr:hypothetical protein PR202_ga25107 [Eleusine coracana subsp. coracana]